MLLEVEMPGRFVCIGQRLSRRIRLVHRFVHRFVVVTRVEHSGLVPADHLVVVAGLGR